MQLLESAFKKNTVGFVIREQFVEKVRAVYTFLAIWWGLDFFTSSISATQVFLMWSASLLSGLDLLRFTADIYAILLGSENLKLLFV